ncbi:phage holin family protein [Sedimentibacter sp.]|uniref:phage holin family protein n=1 Tax=Sedimentibacter sp. TaxID=1960295 RepID=UPI0028A70F04|nr:phage holin family protein [Sedimentibacter sp.]
MENVTTVKVSILGAVGVIGSIIANALGGWDMALRVLVLFMAVDYITGLIVAGVFKKSGKSEMGALESKAGFKGLCRKGMILGIVFIATQLDLLSGTELIRDTVIIGYVVNEAVSIIENAGLMGVPIPDIIKRALEILKSKKGDKND